MCTQQDEFKSYLRCEIRENGTAAGLCENISILEQCRSSGVDDVPW
jgi:hypothetical protein